MAAIWYPPKQVRDPELNFHYLDDEDPQENYSGEKVGGRYKLIEPIGPGGTSTVYRAEDERTGSKVAVKILHSSLHERLLGYFGQEGRVAARHSNPHVIQAFDFGCEEGCAFTVFKFVDGVSLQALAWRGPIPWQRVCRITLQVLSALHELHRVGIIHNDLHPSNVMLRRDIADTDFAVVIDFGFATVLPTTKITNAPVPDDTVYGLRRYVAPERCAGCPPDPRSDLYALGVLMWEVMTAQMIPDFMIAPGKIAVPTLAMIAPGLEIPERVDRIVMRALSDVEHRFHDAEEMAQAIRDAIEEGVAATPAPRLPTWGPHAQRAALAGAALLGGLIGGAAVGVFLSFGRGDVAEAAGAQAVYGRQGGTELEVARRPDPSVASSPEAALAVEREPDVPASADLAGAEAVPAGPAGRGEREAPAADRTTKPSSAKSRREQRARRGIRVCDREGKQVKSEVTIEARHDGAPQVRFNGRTPFGDLGDCVAELAKGLGLQPGETLRFRL